MNTYRADLHIHTVLSPCGDLEMSPGSIVKQAAEKGLDMIAVTDHNHTGHALLTRELGARRGIWVVYGAEITTREEVHCLTFFDTDEQLRTFQQELDRNIVQIAHDSSMLGYQVVVDEQDQIVKEIAHSLYAALNWSIEEAADVVHDLGGLFVPAHVDRLTNGLYAQLGLFPEELDADAVEISRHTSPKEAKRAHPELEGYSLLHNSDAHYRDDIGRAGNRYVMKNRSFKELRMALKGEDGRAVLEW
jgi:PHP family Zn ribbon phosphoesterase